MHADRTNRTALIAFALVLVAVGGVGVASTFGVFGSRFQHSPLSDNAPGHFILRNGQWLWPAAAGVALVIALLSIRWLFTVLFSTDRAPDLLVPGGGGTGLTTLAPSALTAAVITDIENLSGVTSASARVVGDDDEPHLIIDTRVRMDTDLVDLRQRIVTGPIANVRQAVGDQNMPVRLNLIATKTTERRIS